MSPVPKKVSCRIYVPCTEKKFSCRIYVLYRNDIDYFSQIWQKKGGSFSSVGELLHNFCKSSISFRWSVVVRQNIHGKVTSYVWKIFKICCACLYFVFSTWNSVQFNTWESCKNMKRFVSVTVTPVFKAVRIFFKPQNLT